MKMFHNHNLILLAFNASILSFLPIPVVSFLSSHHVKTFVSQCHGNVNSFALPTKSNQSPIFPNPVIKPITKPSILSTHLNLFDSFAKAFEEEGPLGKGITVGKVQVALQSDRSSSSIFGFLEKKANTNSDDIAQLGQDVCLALLRKSDEWTAACSSSKWFSENDEGKAEREFNILANKEASKFEKEYIPDADSDEKGGGITLVVISLVIEIQGDTTTFEGAGYSLAGTKDVLSSIASDCTVEGGECLNALEVFWTPSERKEVLSFRDAVTDFPELIDL